MNGKYIALAAVIVLAIAVVPLGDSDGLASIERPDGTLKFDNMSGGDLKFTIRNTGAGATSFDMDVTVTENGKEVASLKGYNVGVGNIEITVGMGDFKSVGTHHLVVACSPSSMFEGNTYTFSVDVEVTKNLLSDWITYVVILIVIIVIAVFAYLKIRDSPKKKTEMTFEQLEAERKAEMSAKGEKKKSKEPAPTTERQRYLANKKKKE